MERVRLAVVGAGGQCTKSLMPPIPFIEEIELIAVCDLKRELAERNARNFGAPSVYTDVDQMLSKEKPDACMVVGPPQMHEDVGLQVLDAGCPLFIEKPAAPTIEGAERLAKAAADKGLVGQVGHMMRHAGPVRVARELSEKEEFGQLLSVESKYTTWPTGVMSGGRGWGEPDEDWSYMLVQGGHPIDLLRHFLGEITRVAAFRKHGAGNAKVFQVTAEGEGGKVGFLNLQDSYNGWYTGLELVGDGQAVIRVDDLGRLTYRRGEQRTEVETISRGYTAYTWDPHHTLPPWIRSGYGSQFQHFAQCIMNGEQAYPSLADGWRNLVVAQAILDSCAQGQVVTVPQ